jgi:glycosyltransferase involved in cell wall biosynthesis
MRKSDCTVIIPVKNGTNFLAEAIHSVRAQTLQVSRILVIDDHSEDETVSLCRKLDIECIPSVGNGQAAATNLGIRMTTTEYLAILDHDDWWNEKKVELQTTYLNSRPDTFGVYSRVVNVFSDARPEVKFPVTRLFGSATLRRNIFNSVGLIDESLTSASVIIWWTEVAKSGIKVDSLDIPALNRRIHGENFGIAKKNEAEENLMRVLRSKIHSNNENL